MGLIINIWEEVST